MLELIVRSRTEDLLEELARHTGLAAGLHLPFASIWLWDRQCSTSRPTLRRTPPHGSSNTR